MGKNKQFDRLNKNYEELEDDKKDILLVIGENLLNIQNIVNNELRSSFMEDRLRMRIYQLQGIIKLLIIEDNLDLATLGNKINEALKEANCNSGFKTISIRDEDS